MGSTLIPWLTKALQVVGVAAAQEVIQYVYTEITTQDSEPTQDYGQFIKQMTFLSAALDEFGLGGMAVLHDTGCISAGELFYCAILSWSTQQASLPIGVLDDLEAFGIDNLASIDLARSTSITKDQDVAKLTNNVPALAKAMNFLLQFGRAQNLPALVPSATKF